MQRRRQAPESLATCLWTHRKGEDAGFGKIMWGKIMQSFYDFARHDFALFLSGIGNARLMRLPENR